MVDGGLYMIKYREYKGTDKVEEQIKYHITE